MKKVFVITGPTASGKTILSYQIASRIKEETNAEPVIISADSRQLYKEIPIATAQPPLKYQKKFKHYFVNELHPEMEFNAGDFGKAGRHLIKDLFAEHKIPLVVGGSGLYIRSLIYGLFDLENETEGENGTSLKNKQTKIRQTLNKRLETEGPDKLYKELFTVDPDAAARMSAAVPRRVIRALEVFYLTGIPISHQHKKNIPIEYEFIQYALKFDRGKLYDRINQRVDEMIENGLIKEVKVLALKGYHYKYFNSLNTVGIKEVFDHLEGKIDIETMVSLIKQNTRRYAKRQMTWFRKDKKINWIEVNNEKDIVNAADMIFNKVSSAYPYLMWR